MSRRTEGRQGIRWITIPWDAWYALEMAGVVDESHQDYDDEDNARIRTMIQGKTIAVTPEAMDAIEDLYNTAMHISQSLRDDSGDKELAKAYAEDGKALAKLHRTLERALRS